MILTVLDGNGAPQQVIVKGQEAVVDRSGAIAATGVSQTLLAANVLRSGWTMQNRSSTNPMYVNEIGAAASTGSGSFLVPPGGFFPPEGHPVSTAAVAVLGTLGDTFTAREW